MEDSKTEVRALAKKIGLNTAEKKILKDFAIGKVKLPVFLQQQLKPRSGKVIEIDRNTTHSIHRIKKLAPRVRISTSNGQGDW